MVRGGVYNFEIAGPFSRNDLPSVVQLERPAFAFNRLRGPRLRRSHLGTD